MATNRVSSGIEGLDGLIEGGFPEGSNILVTGGPGTGKSIFGLQYVVQGALKGEPGVYLTVEESKGRIISQAQQFGWDLEKLEKEKKIILNNIEEYDIDVILGTLEKEVKQLKAKRVVVDSLSMMSIFARDLDQVTKVVKKKDLIHTSGRELGRTQIVGILRKLSELGTTNMIVSESEGEVDKIAEYVADGVISIEHLPSAGSSSRTLNVKKLRATKIDDSIHPIEISSKGIVVKKQNELYAK